MFTKLIHTLWGDLSGEEIRKFSILSCIITLILGNYWMLRVLKNPIFHDLVGLEYQPFAKMISIFVVALVILIYSKLVDLFSKKNLFDIICLFYAGMFFLVCAAAFSPETFSMSPTSVFYPFVSWIPGQLIGWLSYFTFESSSLMIILFWAFVTSVTQPESAKKGYAMIVTCTQLGTITGSAFVAHFATTLGAPFIIGIGGGLTLLVPLLVRFYMRVIPLEPGSANHKAIAKKPKTGFFEGLKLIATKPYVMGILVVSTVYEIIATILEFQMNMVAKEIFVSRDLYAAFTGKYGMSTNGLALVFALLGTSFFMRRYGLRFCLLAYPSVVGFVLCSLLSFKLMGATDVQFMWALFAAMVAVKGFSYALNNPTKEVLYIPTTQDVRFKAKGWIESFGGRSFKATGALVTATFARNLSGLLLYGTFISLGVVGIWLIIANLLGKKYNVLQKTAVKSPVDKAYLGRASS